MNPEPPVAVVPAEPEIMYQAMLSRDRRFDGRFFVAVRTTGIYCRPICPASKPKFVNVEFYPSAAGAESAGFRPCKRCRPDTAPGTAIWSGTSAIVSQALCYIEEGFLDEGDVEALGDLLGVGERQLRRLFQEHLGASPHAIALTRRLDFARKLIDQTTLSMTDIAFAAGFESIRRFNDAVKKRFGQNPTELRKLVKTKQGENPNHLSLRLPFRPPLDWDSLYSYLQGRQMKGVEVVEANGYSRSLRFGESQGIFTVRPIAMESALELTLWINHTAGLMELVRRVSRIFDLGADPFFITQHLARDRGLQEVIARYPGLRVPGSWDNFEIAIRTIIGQQVSIAGANTVMARLVRLCGEEITHSREPGITHFFPTPQAIASLSIGALASLGMPGKRAETIITLATKVAQKELQLEGVLHPDALRRELLAIPGIGAWTVEYIAMRALRDPDAFPASDLGLKRELERLDITHTIEGIKRPDMWRPWSSYAAMYLWKSYGANENKNKKKE